MPGLRLAFLGTPDFAVPSLTALAEAGHDIACVYSQPPRPAGRGHKERPSPVQQLAEAHGWPLRTPASLKAPEAQAAFSDLALDAAVVAAYGLILPKAILDAPRLGCLNVHASLLPRWRGAAPIQRAILAGDAQTGVTIMQMDEGLDTGAILLQRAVPIGPQTTAATLHDELAVLGAALVVEALAGLAAGTLAGRPQDEALATYADKLGRDDGRLDWRRPAADLARQVRALTPWPGAFAELPGGGRLKVLAAEAVDGHGAPGAMLDNAPTVACGDGALRLIEVQKAGKAPMEGAVFLRGSRLAPGAVLPCGDPA
ncbi:MAG: methionyl-tRNA formyltransferase [Kiloniellales bacterium]|nr:methionyl-tRNA formyltransferase [Kiloniellales bacterium]